MRISRIQLSDHLLPAACAASQADGSLSLPVGTTDSVYTGTDSSSASVQTANCVDVCVGAIIATRSARPNRSGERSGCCCRPGSRYTTHSRPDSTSESPHRSARYWETTGPPRAPEPGYVGASFKWMRVVPDATAALGPPLRLIAAPHWPCALTAANGVK